MNWSEIASGIIRFRIFILVLIAGLTAFMALQVPRLKLDYGYSGMMPDSDSISINLEEFRKTFGGDANIIIVGVKDEKFFEAGKFVEWKELRSSLLRLDGVESVFSVSEAVLMRKNINTSKFEILPVFPDSLIGREDLARQRELLDNLPMYDKLLYSKDAGVYILALFMDPLVMDTKKRETIMEDIERLSEEWGDRFGREIHYSGLPFIRSILLIMIKTELVKFIYLASIVAFILMLFFFRSFKAVIPCVLVVGSVVGFRHNGSDGLPDHCTYRNDPALNDCYRSAELCVSSQ